MKQKALIMLVLGAVFVKKSRITRKKPSLDIKSYTGIYNDKMYCDIKINAINKKQ